MRKYFFVLATLITSEALFSQNYSYRDYLNDQVVSGKIYRYTRNNNIDSLELIIRNYKNRLGFTYYQCKALIANRDSDPSQLKYLDSAFARGMTPLCIDRNMKKFDSVKVYESFKRNYLKAYNPRLINMIDSIHYKDQQYRQQMTFWYNQPDEINVDSKKVVEEKKEVKLKQPTKKEALDSLWKLQSNVDSTNLLKLKEIIDKYGWPSAKLVGDHYCQRPGPDVTILFIHLGNTKRDYQIATLKKVIELCKKQEDSWQTAESLIFGLHTKFSREFSEFSFLEMKNNRLNLEESFFSIYKMAEIKIRGSNSRIEIKCAKASLFNELKQAMLSINELITFHEKDLESYEKMSRPLPKKLDESSFLFIESPELKDDIILYKFVKK